MFSTLSPAFLFDTDGRLVQPMREVRGNSIIKPKGHKESRLVASLNLALSGLNPNHTTTRITTIVDSPLPSPYSSASYVSTTSSSRSRKAHSPYTASMSSTHSSRSSGSDLSKMHDLHELISRHSSVRGSKSRPRLKSQPAATSRESLPPHPAFHLREGATSSYTSRPSIDSIDSAISERSSTSSAHNHTHKKERGKERRVPIVVPPPLRLERSNLHRTSLSSPVIEITAPPRADSKAALPQPSPQASPRPPHLRHKPRSQSDPATPTSPGFQIPSEEEQRRRRLEKLMRTLGEDVPAELVYRGGAKPIINVNVFPDPPAPVDGGSLTKKERRAAGGGGAPQRRGSFTLSALPIPGLHARGKSRDLANRPESPSTPIAAPRDRGGDGYHYTVRRAVRPESVLLSPMVFRRPVSQLLHPDDLDDEWEHGGARPGSSGGSRHRRKGEEGGEGEQEDRASKLARRSSLHTATILPPSPTYGSFHHHQNVHHQDHYNHSPGPSPDPLDTPRASPRRISTRPGTAPTLSPTTAAHQPTPPRPPPKPQTPPAFRLVVDNGDANGHDDNDDMEDGASSSGSRTPPAPRSAPRSPHGSFTSTRPDTPFSDAGVPIPGLLVPPGSGGGFGPSPESVYDTVYGSVSVSGSGKKGKKGKSEGKGGKDGRELVARREKRQGWSGEWNRGDMQDVIQRLRTLK